VAGAAADAEAGDDGQDLLGEEAAVGMEDLAGEVARLVAGEEQRGVRDLALCAHAAHRDLA
jgi:hypothetical protein